MTISPVIALIAGSSSIASSLAWIEPVRPYLIGGTALALGFAWYQKVRPQAVEDCNCSVTQKPNFIQSQSFLVLVTIFAALMIAFPYYSGAFFPNNSKSAVVSNSSHLQKAEFKISGMTCSGCEAEVQHEVFKLNGVIKADVSYKNADALIEFDNSKTTVAEIEKAINTTGYKVISSTIKN